MDPNGVRITLSEREICILRKKTELLDKAIARIRRRSLDLFFKNDLSTNSFVNNYINTNLNRSLDGSLENSPKRPRRRKRLRNDDEEEQLSEDHQGRMRIIELGQATECSASPRTKHGDPSLYKNAKYTGLHRLKCVPPRR
jgi:hypothetical protein